VSDRFEFIDAEHAAGITNINVVPPLARMCVLMEVSRSGFYEWRGRPASATAERREELKLFIRKSFGNWSGASNRVCDYTAAGIHGRPSVSMMRASKK